MESMGEPVGNKISARNFRESSNGTCISFLLSLSLFVSLSLFLPEHIHRKCRPRKRQRNKGQGGDLENGIESTTICMFASSLLKTLERKRETGRSCKW